MSRQPAPADYTATSGTLTFPVGTTTQTASVPIVTDSTGESNETFSVDAVRTRPTPPSPTAPAPATIVNDDQSLPTLVDQRRLRHRGHRRLDHGDAHSDPVGASSTQTVTVTAPTANGTATSPAATTPAAAARSPSPPAVDQRHGAGASRHRQHGRGERDVHRRTCPTRPTPPSPTAPGVGTILDDDQPLPALSISDVAISEGTGGTTTATLHDHAVAASSQAVTVHRDHRRRHGGRAGATTPLAAASPPSRRASPLRP